MSPNSRLVRNCSGAVGWVLAALLRVSVLGVSVGLLHASVAAAAEGESGHEGQAEQTGPKKVLTATSVCEAQRFRVMAEDDPSIELDIPAEFDKQWPSLSACTTHDAAWDVDADGPRQPIPFSHKHHAGEFGIDCQYCHSGTDRSRAAGVPSVELCMGCHAQFPAEYDELEGIRLLKQHWEDKTPIEWKQIHRMPEYVKFPHRRHVQSGLECQQCHGPVEEIDKLHLVPDDSWWYGVPVAKLEMGWCIQCHRENNQQATQDCMACHY